MKIYLFNLFNYLNGSYFTCKSQLLSLKKIYTQWPLAFWAVLLFIVAQVFFMAKGIENVPFFLYHMYGQKHPPRDSIGIYLVKTTDGYFNHKKLSNREQEILMNSVSYYVNLRYAGHDGINESIKKRFEKILSGTGYEYLQKHLANDSVAIRNFPQWWSRYFSSVSNTHAGQVSVIKTYVYSKPPYHKSGTDSLIFTINLE